MRSSTASSTPRTALPSTAKPCANNRKTPPSAENLTTIPPSEPLKWSTGAAVRDHRNAVRDRSERCPQSIGITVRIRWNPQFNSDGRLCPVVSPCDHGLMQCNYLPKRVAAGQPHLVLLLDQQLQMVARFAGSSSDPSSVANFMRS